MANLVEWIDDAFSRAGETPQHVVIGDLGGSDYGSDGISGYAEQPRFQVIPFEQAKKHIDYWFDAGYGSPGCNAIYVWSESWIFALSQYDGSVAYFMIPRHPQMCEPVMPGGS